MTCEPFDDGAACSTYVEHRPAALDRRRVRPEDAVATHGLLDDFALALFGMAGSEPPAQADRLMRLMTRELHFAAHGEDSSCCC